MHQINADFTQLTTFVMRLRNSRFARTASPAMSVRLGVGYYLLGRFESAIQVLAERRRRRLALFYLGKAYLASGNRFDKALRNTKRPRPRAMRRSVRAARAETLRTRGQVQEAMDILDQLFGPIEQTADYLYHRGATVPALGGNPAEVVALYERSGGQPTRTMPAPCLDFALENDRRGNDGIAIELYQRAVQCFPRMWARC